MDGKRARQVLIAHGFWFGCCVLGCASEASAPVSDASAVVPDASAAMGPGPVADAAPTRPAFCDRAGDDVVRDAFCGATLPEIRSLSELMQRLSLELAPIYDETHPEPEDPLANAFVEYGNAVLLSHSTALSGRLVSPINPRAILMNSKLFLAFNRGVQQVEIAAMDRQRNLELNFYLVSFKQACNKAALGCSFGDLYTPRIESDWTRVTLQDGEDLKNTPSDCLQCHQRASDVPLRLMREFDGPWTHFFGPMDGGYVPLPFDEATGTDLLMDYLAAKADEPYSGLTTQHVQSTIGFTLQNMVRGSRQPLIFDGSAILNERWPYRDGGFPEKAQPSATWGAAYAAFKRGEQLALPYFAPRATDPAKQARLTAAYQSYRRGELPAEALPDLADIFPDDPQTRAEIGLQVEPGAAPADALIQACGTCHNDVLDQSISRARFNIALTRIDRQERERAIERIRLPRSSPLAMPPADARQLDAEAILRLTEYLQSDQRPSDDDARLERAAQLGMAGPNRR